MRAEGDLLLSHVASARSSLLLCAPFIKAPVLARVLRAVGNGVDVDVVTRWHAREVAAGVSDLEAFDVVGARPGTRLRLLDRLHAKLYVADGRALLGSANLTATALGWCDAPNLETLTEVPGDADAVRRCVAALDGARPATTAERDRVRAAADAAPAADLPEAGTMDEARAHTWLPISSAPARLFPIYAGRGLDRLTSSVIDSGRSDLEALGLPDGLDEAAFTREVADRLRSAAAMRPLMERIGSDLADSDAVVIVGAANVGDDMAADTRWGVVREWITYFLADTVEVVPQSFIVRPRPGKG